MLTLLGVGHVFNLAARIRGEIEARAPAVVALELDEARLHALRTRQPQSRGPSLYNLLALFQRRVARRYGVEVGEEMLAAYEVARELQVPTVFIDVDSQVTWQRLRSSMGPRELLKILFSSVGALFVRKGRIERELARYQDDSVGFLEAVGREYPAVKRVVVDDRNAHMAARLRALHEAYGTVVAIVGDGHVVGLAGLLQDLPLQVVRLWDLRRGPPAG